MRLLKGPGCMLMGSAAMQTPDCRLADAAWLSLCSRVQTLPHLGLVQILLCQPSGIQHCLRASL